MRTSVDRTRAARARPRGEAGFTLIELLIVMSLIAVLMGIGVGVFANFNAGDRVAISNVQSVLRSAHNSAVARVAPARVVIDRETNSLHAEGEQVIGTWHFESEPLTGAFGFECVKVGGQIVKGGFQGRALSFEGEPKGSRVDFAVQLDPSWNLAHGFTFRFAVRQSETRGGVLLDAGSVIGIESTDDGALKAWFVAQRAADESASGKGGRVAIATDPHALTAERWSTVEIAYDRSTLSIRVDGQIAASLVETAPVAPLEGPLVLSPAQYPYPGAIDALVVSAIVADDLSELPKDVAFAKDAPREIVFQAGGGLDREKHREPVRLGLEFDDGRKEVIYVNLYGTVE